MTTMRLRTWCLLQLTVITLCNIIVYNNNLFFVENALKNLIRGIAEFRRNLTDEYRELFAKLALGQRPDALFIACSDSRVVPNLFASTNPGDLFVLRNIGNLIPPASSTSNDNSAQAAIEFSVFNLNIADIIICGHSECGAMQALVNGIDCTCCPHLGEWLKHGEESRRRVDAGETIDSKLSVHNQVSQMNVLQQMAHIEGYPFVRERLEQKKLRLHGWWFDIAKAEVYCYDEASRRFIPIDDAYAQIILARLL